METITNVVLSKEVKAHLLFGRVACNGTSLSFFKQTSYSNGGQRLFASLL